MMRLDKYLADMGLGTRSELKKAIRGGRVSVNQAPARKPELKIDENSDQVSFDGRTIEYRSMEYWMLHKPAGVVSATRDLTQRTVLDLLGDDRRKDLFPVGRLDKDTEGLLLVTNDGDMAHRLLAPGKHVDKTYYAEIDRAVDERVVAAFREGIDIGDDTPTLPAELEILDGRAGSESRPEHDRPAKDDPASDSPVSDDPTNDGPANDDPAKDGPTNDSPVNAPTANAPTASGAVFRVLVTIQEGRYHQIKRMFEACGMKVLYLKRLSMGGLVLDENLEKGAARRLTKEELERLC